MYASMHILMMRGPTLTKIAYKILKSFDFIEIKSDFSDFKNANWSPLSCIYMVDGQVKIHHL